MNKTNNAASSLGDELGYNPYRDTKGRFDDGPQLLKALGKRKVPFDDNRKKIEAAKLRLQSEFQTPKKPEVKEKVIKEPKFKEVPGFDLSKIGGDAERMILWRDKELFPGQTYGEYYKTEKAKAADVFMLSPAEYRQALVDSGTYADIEAIERRMDKSKVDEYANDMRNGDKFPPAELLYAEGGYDGQEGLHRVYAAEQVGIEEIPVIVSHDTRNQPDLYKKYSDKITAPADLYEKEESITIDGNELDDALIQREIDTILSEINDKGYSERLDRLKRENQDGETLYPTVVDELANIDDSQVEMVLKLQAGYSKKTDSDLSEKKDSSSQSLNSLDDYIKDWLGEPTDEVTVADFYSDPETLREEAQDGKVSDGIYEGGNDYLYEVKDGKVSALKQYRTQYDFKTGELKVFKRNEAPEDITKIPIFHNTDADIASPKDLDIKRSGQNFGGIGGNEFDAIYFRTDPTDSTFGKNTVVAQLSPDSKVIRYNDLIRDFRDNGAEEQDLNQYAKENYDAVVKLDDVGEAWEVIVLNQDVINEHDRTQGVGNDNGTGFSNKGLDSATAKTSFITVEDFSKNKDLLIKKDPDFYRADNLERLNDAIGFNGKPQTADKIPEGATQLHRVWADQAFYDSYMNDETPRLSVGIYGSGIYFSTSSEGARTSANTSQDKMVYSQAFIDPTAKGVDAAEIGNQMFEEGQEVSEMFEKELAGLKKIKDKVKRAEEEYRIQGAKRAAEALYRDAGLYAAVKGYDYIFTSDNGSTDQQNEFIVINRAKVTFLNNPEAAKSREDMDESTAGTENVPEKRINGVPVKLEGNEYYDKLLADFGVPAQKYFDMSDEELAESISNLLDELKVKTDNRLAEKGLSSEEVNSFFNNWGKWSNAKLDREFGPEKVKLIREISANNRRGDDYLLLDNLSKLKVVKPMFKEVPDDVIETGSDRVGQPGKYHIYRAGDFSRRIAFTDMNPSVGETYSFAGFGDNDSVVRGYVVDIKNPFVSTDINDALTKLGSDKHFGELGFVKADNFISKALLDQGYDAWIKTDPEPPADTEVNLIKGSDAYKQAKSGAALTDEWSYRDRLLDLAKSYLQPSAWAANSDYNKWKKETKEKIFEGSGVFNEFEGLTISSLTGRTKESFERDLADVEGKRNEPFTYYDNLVPAIQWLKENEPERIDDYFKFIEATDMYNKQYEGKKV